MFSINNLISFLKKQKIFFKTVTNNKEFAETVNMHFGNIIPNLNGDSNLKYDIPHQEPKSFCSYFESRWVSFS